jgi:hypothetical protein
VLGHSDYLLQHESFLYGWKPGPGRPSRGRRKGSRWQGDTYRRGEVAITPTIGLTLPAVGVTRDRIAAPTEIWSDSRAPGGSTPDYITSLSKHSAGHIDCRPRDKARIRARNEQRDERHLSYLG